jgi:integrase
MATTFTVDQARAIMEFMELHEGGRWVPYFALCLFAGIRPGVPDGEITKLKPEEVNLETGIINIRPGVSKVREPRRITIQPNLAAWLKAYPLDTHPIIVPNFKKRREEFKDKLRRPRLNPTESQLRLPSCQENRPRAHRAGKSRARGKHAGPDLWRPGILPRRARRALRQGHVVGTVAARSAAGRRTRRPPRRSL